VRLTLSELPGVLLWALPLVPLVAAATAAAMPRNDRLALRALGVGALVLALVVGLAVVAVGWGASGRGALAGGALVGGALVAPPLWPVLTAMPALRLDPTVVTPLVTVLLVAPLALRAGAPRVREGMAPYVVTCLVQSAAITGTLLVSDLVDTFAAALVAALPGFALVALFGGPERGTVTWRAAALWLVVDGLAIAALVGPARLAPVPGEMVTLAVLGPGLVRLAAGPWGLWALPYNEMAPVAGAVTSSAMSFPLGAVLLWRGAVHVGPASVASLAPVLSALFAGSVLIGGVLVTMERDLRRVAAHWVGLLGSVVALGVLASAEGGARDAIGLACVGGLAIALLLMVVEAIERRLETRRVVQLAGLWHAAPLLAGLLPLALMAVAGVPGPGSALALWRTLAVILRADQAIAWGGAAAVVGILMGWMGCAIVVARVVLPQQRKHGQFIRVSFMQAVRLGVPLLALIALSAALGPLGQLGAP
jgi:NADH-quinone oxidoreductase subunit M